METMKMTTITVSEKTRRELLKVAAELQSSRGEKVGYEDAIEWLLLKSRRNSELLRRAMIGSGIPSEEFRKTLREGREEDRRHEEALERRYLR
jgi:predicted CopG family antitoxin